MSMATTSPGMRALAALGRCVRAPFRVLVRARDLYVSRMAACAGGGPVGLVAVPRNRSHGFYRSAAGGDEDVRELVRAGKPTGVVGPPRSHSVAFGRIDEDRPCELGLEDGALGPRSRSCTVGPTARTAAPRV
jgi:hypothetical protein